MPSIQFLAIWTIAGEFPLERKEAFTQAFIRAQKGDRDAEPAAFASLITRALALSAEDQAALVEFLVGSIEADQGG